MINYQKLLSIPSRMCSTWQWYNWHNRSQWIFSAKVVVQFLSHVWLFVTPWTAAHQASLSFATSWSLLKLISIESMMPHNHLILCCPLSSCLQSFPASGSFLKSRFFASGGQSIGASASASVLPMNTQDWFPLALIGLISLQSKGFSRVFFNTTVQKHRLFGATLPSLWSSSHYWTNCKN